ncbi:MAG: hypothetical protein WDA53_01275 [Bacillota bacterium]
MIVSRPSSLTSSDLHQDLKTWSPTKKLVSTAMLAIIAAILQSAGGWIPGAGFLISPFATIPILFAAIISLKNGFFAYLSAIFLLVLFEPGELFIFPFTTGLLGLSIGWRLSVSDKPLAITLISGIILFIGICIPLYGLGFPVLGPAILPTPQLKTVITIFGFSLLYSWLWLVLSRYLLRRLGQILLPTNEKVS